MTLLITIGAIYLLLALVALVTLWAACAGGGRSEESIE